MQLFKIGSNDYTTKITLPSYKINGLPYYKEWNDGNHKTHRHVYLNKLEGSFTIYFDDTQEYFDFMADVRNNTTDDGSIFVSLYDNLRNTVVENVEVYLSMTPANELPYYGAKQHDGFDVTIKER